MTTHQGSCHCGRIAFAVEGDVRDVVECNCSICRRRGSLLAFFPREAFALSTAEGDYATYRFNRHVIDHHFCTTCGVAPFSEGIAPGTGARMVAVNVRCLADVDLATLNVRQFDGASL